MPTKFSDPPKKSYTKELIGTSNAKVWQPLFDKTVTVKSPLDDSDMNFEDFKKKFSDRSDPDVVNFYKKKFGPDALSGTGLPRQDYINRFITEHSNPSFRNILQKGEQNPTENIFPQSVIGNLLEDQIKPGVSDEEASQLYNFLPNKKEVASFKCGGKMKTKFGKK